MKMRNNFGVLLLVLCIIRACQGMVQIIFLEIVNVFSTFEHLFFKDDYHPVQLVFDFLFQI